MNFAKEYLEKLGKGLEKINVEKIEEIVDLMILTLKNNNQIFIVGNGGSAAVASHMACDLGKGTLKKMYDPEEKRFKVISLTDNNPLITALANDVGYENIFSQQLNNLIKRGDLLIVISGSGNSENVIKSVRVAQNFKANTIAFLGSDGGKIKDLVDYSLIYDETHYGRIEDSASILSHLICSWIKEKLKSNSNERYFKEEAGERSKVLITGGAGFIGSNLARELVKEGYDVSILDDFSYGSMLNLTKENGEPITKIYRGSICDSNLVELMKGVDYVYHFAAISCLPICLNEPYRATQVNVAGTLNVLEAARLNNVKRVIFASSSAVYENNEKFPSKEEDDVNPHAIYSVQKYTGEEFCKAYRKLYNMDITIVRYFNLYGPNQDYTRQKPPVMSYIIKELLQNKTPVMYGSGEQKRDFLFIDDVTELNKLLIKKEGAKNETFNVGSGKIYSINEIYQEVDNILKTGIAPIRKLPEDMYEGIGSITEGKTIDNSLIAKETNKFTQADISKAKQLLGWEPKVELKEGILASVNFIKKMTKPDKNIKIKQALIFCGGCGERLRPITDTIPKPMVGVNGKPFLEHLINQLKSQGISEFILCTGYKKEVIEDYFGDGAKFGVEIKYSRGPLEWEQAKRLWEAKGLLDDYFLMLYADNYVPAFNLNDAINFYSDKGKALSLVIFSKLEKNNLKIDENNLITVYDKTRTEVGLNYVELGYMIANKEKIFEETDGANVSLQETIKKLVAKKEIAGLVTRHKYQSISDIERLNKTKEYFSPKKILLIDRDGVINQKAPRGEYILKLEELKLIEESITAMKRLSEEGFQYVLVTNQPAISKGIITDREFNELQNYLVEKLKERGVNILDIFYCPHKVEDNCECRKPKPKMLIDACNKYLIDPEKTIYIGDDERDCLAAKRAGCKSVLIGKDYDLELNRKYHNTYVEPDYSANNLLDSLDYIREQFNQRR